ELPLLRPDPRGAAGGQDRTGAAASTGRLLGHLQGSLSRQVLLFVSSGRTGGILSGLSPSFAALEGDTAAECAVGNKLRGHRKRSIGSEPAAHQLCRASVGR